MTGKSLASQNLSHYSSRSERARREQREYAASIVPYLADRCYHLPGNSCCQDWFQYFMNNHPVFGICCHHQLHPIGMGQRIVTLIGSVAFGLILTNIFFLSLISTDEAFDQLDNSVLSINVNTTVPGFTDNGNNSTDASGKSITITYGMILLWTVGTSIHSLFDLSIWYMSACACCHPGGCLESFGCCKKLGSHVVIFFVTIVVAVATVIVVYRASIESQEAMADEDRGETTAEGEEVVKFGKVNGVESFDFLLSWSVELAVALFVTYFLVGTILFSGVLGCGRAPYLGGRPREIWLEEQESYELRRSGTDATERV